MFIYVPMVRYCSQQVAISIHGIICVVLRTMDTCIIYISMFCIIYTVLYKKALFAYGIMASNALCLFLGTYLFYVPLVRRCSRRSSYSRMVSYTLYSVKRIHVYYVSIFCIMYTVLHKKAVFAVWREPVGCLIFIGHCPQKSAIISGSFAKNDLQLQASYGSSPPCTYSIKYIIYLFLGACLIHVPMARRYSCTSRRSSSTYLHVVP